MAVNLDNPPKPANKDWRADRTLKDVGAPVWKPLESSKIWKNGKPDVNILKEHFRHEGRLREEDAIKITKAAQALLMKEPNLLHLTDPITVVGDIHGQFYDLLKMFDIAGPPDKNQFLFLGDYVDRGCFSCEVTLLLLACKINHPRTFWMLRGNHECRHLTAYFNFKQECVYKYGTKVYDSIMDCFDYLPLAVVLNKKFLCVHGGLSPEIKMADDINKIDRVLEPPTVGPMCDLIWSDPMDEEDEELNPGATFISNDVRGCSHMFSWKATCDFLTRNKLLAVIRAHEAQDEGYRLYKKTDKGFPSVICIFSAPNYCDAYNNKAAIVRFQKSCMNIRQFNSVEHPYYLPNFMNAFDWSLPFVQDKLSDMLMNIWHMVDADEDENNEESKAAIKKRILAMGRVAKIYKGIAAHNENIVKMGALINKNSGEISSDTIDSVKTFSGAKKLDAANEKGAMAGH